MCIEVVADIHSCYMMFMTCTGLQTSFGDGVECLKAEVVGLLAKYKHYSSGVVRLEVKLHACRWCT